MAETCYCSFDIHSILFWMCNCVCHANAHT